MARTKPQAARCTSLWGDPFFGQARCRLPEGHEGQHQSEGGLSWGLHKLAAGMRVCCGYRDGHRGTLLAHDDPRAWAGSIAFPTASPDPTAVAAHAARFPERTPGRWPVLWDFGKVYWDTELCPIREEV